MQHNETSSGRPRRSRAWRLGGLAGAFALALALGAPAAASASADDYIDPGLVPIDPGDGRGDCTLTVIRDANGNIIAVTGRFCLSDPASSPATG
jgi:hypothetical protein